MTAPAFELRRAIIAHLKLQPAVMALTQGLYDRVQEPLAQVAFPYVSWGPEQIVRTDDGCGQNYEVYFQLDVWSRTPGRAECENLCFAIEQSLHGITLALAGNTADIECDMSRILQDPDGMTSHGVMSMKATTWLPL